MNSKKRFWIWLILVAGLFLLSCGVGRYELSPIEIWRIVTGQEMSRMDKTLFYEIRLSRTFCVLLSGGALSLAGLVYQGVFWNPLSSPDLLGVNGGCSIGAILGILYLGSSYVAKQGLIFVFGMGTVFLTMILASKIRGSRRYTMVLSGIAVGAIAQAGVMGLKFTADPNRDLPAIEYWLMGSFQNVGWQDVWHILPFILIPGLVLYLLRWKMNVLSLGDDEAESLGIAPNLVRNLSLICATMLVASVISIAGVVGWVGLIGPHIIRMIQGEHYVKNFWSSIMLGGILLLVADILARTLFAAEIPIGIFTSAIGAVVLMIFMSKRRSGNEH